MNARKGFDISLTLIMAFVIVIVLVAFLGTITNTYTGKFLNFGSNTTNSSLINSALLIGGMKIERSN